MPQRYGASLQVALLGAMIAILGWQLSWLAYCVPAQSSVPPRELQHSLLIGSRVLVVLATVLATLINRREVVWPICFALISYLLQEAVTGKVAISQSTLAKLLEDDPTYGIGRRLWSYWAYCICQVGGVAIVLAVFWKNRACKKSCVSRGKRILP